MLVLSFSNCRCFIVCFGWTISLILLFLELLLPFLLLLLCKLNHKLNLREKAHVCAHQVLVEKIVNLRLQKGYKVFRFDELWIHVGLPLNAKFVAQLFDLVHRYLIDRICCLQCQIDQLVQLLDESVDVLHLLELGHWFCRWILLEGRHSDLRILRSKDW